MAGDFAETDLGRLFSFANGRSSPERADGLPYPVYGSNGVIGYASEANAGAGSIIIGRVGSYCGSLYLSKQKCWVTDNAIRATALDDNDPRFLFYLLSTLSLNNWRAGSGQPLLNQDILSRIPAAVPEPAEQRAIAHILGTLDDKIELNRRMNETLEAMARALFESWFIDFDPVRRNAARPRNQPSPPAPLPGGEGRNGLHYRGGYDFAGLLEAARALRKTPTPAEDVFWELVRDRRMLRLKFRRQHQLGDYIADFYCHEHRVVVELDGGVHSTKQKKDQKRNAWMKARGFTVLRFSNDQFLDDPESVLATIAQVVASTAERLPLPKGEGRGEQSVASTTDLPPLPLGEGRGEGSVEELDRLFPDSFEDSELGEIPKGWGVGPLDQVLLLQRGFDLPTIQRTPGLYPVLAASGPSGTHNEFMARGPGVTTGRSGVLGNVFYVHDDFWPLNTSLWVKDFRHSKPAYAFHLLRGLDFRLFNAGSAVPTLNRNHVHNLPTLLPPMAIIDAFEKTAVSMLRCQKHNADHSETLATLRDTLLPKLISGELRATRADRLIARTEA